MVFENVFARHIALHPFDVNFLDFFKATQWCEKKYKTENKNPQTKHCSPYADSFFYETDGTNYGRCIIDVL